MPPEWEIWPDANISPAIAKRMKDHTGFETKSAYVLHFHTLTDIEIYNKARERGNVILISKDADFAEIISIRGTPPKLINLKIGNCNNRDLWNRIEPHIVKAIESLISNEIDIVELV